MNELYRTTEGLLFKSNIDHNPFVHLIRVLRVEARHVIERDRVRYLRDNRIPLAFVIECVFFAGKVMDPQWTGGPWAFVCTSS